MSALLRDRPYRPDAAVTNFKILLDGGCAATYIMERCRNGERYRQVVRSRPVDDRWMVAISLWRAREALRRMLPVDKVTLGNPRS